VARPEKAYFMERIFLLYISGFFACMRKNNIIFISFFVLVSLDRSTGGLLPLNLQLDSRPLVSLWSTSLSSTCLRQVDGGAALPRPELGHGSELVPRGFAFCAA
jgi:hypothetical protein